MRTKRLHAVTGLLAAAVLTVSCSSGDSGDEAPDAGAGGDAATRYTTGLVGSDPGGEPIRGGTITFAAYSEPRVLDPAQSTVAAATGGIELAAIYDVLMRWDSATNEVVPQLAESLEASPDHTTWTLKLREGVRFSDGTPLDAEAVKWSIERYVGKGADDAMLLRGDITSIGTPDPRTVVIGLARPWASFDFTLTTGPGMIVARSADAGPEFAPVGAGPFTFVRHAPREELVMAANESYWDGRPNLDTVRVVFLNDPHTTVDSLRSGGLDMAILRDPDIVDEVLGEDYRGFLNMVALGNVAVINAAEGRPGSDPRVRKAMQLAIDPRLISTRVYQGAGVATSTIFPDYSRWHTGVEGLPHDPDQARALVEQAKADGFDGAVSYTDGQDPSSRETATAVKAALESVGFQVELDLQRTVADQIRKVSVTRDYDLSGWGISWRESGPYARMFATLHSQGNQTLGMATSPELDALLVEFQAAATDDEQRAVMGRIQQQWNEQVPAVSFGPTPEFVAWSGGVHGVVDNASSIVLLDDAWVDPAG